MHNEPDTWYCTKSINIITEITERGEMFEQFIGNNSNTDENSTTIHFRKRPRNFHFLRTLFYVTHRCYYVSDRLTVRVSG